MNGQETSDPKPRLLVLASTYPRWAGDPEPGFVHELAKRLTGDFEVTVLGPHAPGAARDEILDGVRIHRFRYAPGVLETLVNDGGIITNLKRQPWKWLLVPGFLLGLVWSLWRYNRRWRPHVIHAHWLLPQGLAVAMLLKLGVPLPPFLVTSHGSDLFALQARLLRALKRFVVRQAAAVTVVSGAMLDELTRLRVDTGKVSVLPMGVDLSERFTPDPSASRSHDEILFVGRMVEKKGLRYLIDAMPAILIDHPDAFLSIAGFGPEEWERRDQVVRLALETKIRFIGAVAQDELPALYRRAAVFVAPFVQAASGDREGLGLVSVEAAGCECPIVISDVPGVRQAFRDPPVVEWVLPGDSRELAAGVVRVLSLPDAARQRAVVARQRMSLDFEWTSVAARYATVLSACLRVEP